MVNGTFIFSDFFICLDTHKCFLGGSVEKNPSAMQGTPIPSLLQYSCLGNPMDRGAWKGCKRDRHD